MDVNENMELYENIRICRLKLKLSQEELAKKLGYKSTSTIAKIEAGKIDLPQSKIKTFALALNTTPGALMGWEKQNNDSNFTDEEIELIKNYRQLNTDGKAEINIIINAKLQLQESKSKGTQNRAG